MAEKSMLRFITCGSVDDGKSTLIGRLLFEGKNLTDDQVESLNNESQKFGTTGDDIDYALLVDGLESEREQGITIDVAYRYFSTENRKFIVADTPGHEQYTRNMATGASNADVAIVLMDARKGIITQTKRHTHIAAMLGIKHIIVAVNKMDLMNYDEVTFRKIDHDYRRFVEPMGFGTVSSVPVSARYGDCVTQLSQNIPWFDGQPLMDVLDNLNIDTDKNEMVLRLPIQSVNRPNLNHRSYRGTIASGIVSVGDNVFDVLSDQSAIVENILTPQGNVNQASEGEAVDIMMDREIDLSRGHILSHKDHLITLTNQMEAEIIWFDGTPCYPGRRYLIQTANNQTTGYITNIEYKIDINTMGQLNGKSLDMNDIAMCKLSLQKPIPMDTYATNKITGGFIIIDPVTNNTIGAGMVKECLNRQGHLHWQDTDITAEKRAQIKDQKPLVLWFTGFYQSGKSDISNALEQSLHQLGRHTMILNGDNMRHGLCKDLGFSPTDRIENIRRVSQVANLMADSGLIVLCSFVSPYALDRAMARDIIGDRFVEIFVDTPLETCIENDDTGLYNQAKEGKISEVTGINSPYEVPENPDIHLKTSEQSMSDMVLQIKKIIEDH
jgi:bifunctional enzyme CysN/CysC